MVERDIEVATAASTGYEALNTRASFRGIFSLAREGAKSDGSVQMQRVIDLTQLTKETCKHDFLEWLNVASCLRLLHERSQYGVDLARDRKRMKVDFQDAVQRAKLGRYTLQYVSLQLRRCFSSDLARKYNELTAS